jgi:transposase-like protein
MTKRKRKNYTKEFKEEAVKLITVQGYSVAETARNLGVCRRISIFSQIEAFHKKQAQSYI